MTADSQILVFRGAASQTGLATKARYPGHTLAPYQNWGDISGLLSSQPNPLAVPVWNSHKGEVKNQLWERLLQGEGLIIDLWPAPIKFWHVKRPDILPTTVCSVPVAKEQCSAYIAAQNLAFEALNSTPEAVEAFRGGQCDSVLSAPDQIDESEGYVLVTKDAANPNNFTSFVLIQKESISDPNHIKLSGVSLPRIEEVLNESQQDFFQSLFDDAKTIDDLPRPIFVFNREAESASVGVLFESSDSQTIEVPASVADVTSITVRDVVGKISKRYTETLDALLSESFGDLKGKDFGKHLGSDACLYSCEVLKIHTHGYEADVVEPVFRFYIDRVFQAIKSGLKVSPLQQAFFEKHQGAWEERGRDFISFS